MEELKERHPELYRLYKLRQELHDWYEKDRDLEEAEKALDE